MPCQQAARGAGAYLGVLLVVELLGADPSRRQVVLDGVGEGEVVIPGSGDVPVLDQRVVKVAVERLLHVGDILHLRDATDRDLLSLLNVRLGRRHSAAVGLVRKGCLYDTTLRRNAANGGVSLVLRPAPL